MKPEPKIKAAPAIRSRVVAATRAGKTGNFFDLALECGHVRRMEINHPRIPEMVTCTSCMIEENRRRYIEAKGW